MKTVAVVPVKGLSKAKSRLRGELSPEERAALTLQMLDHVLQVIEQSGVVSSTAVISPEPERLSLPDGIVRLEQTQSGLNKLLEQGRGWAISQEADALLVIFADLPLLSPSDIATITHLGRISGTIVLAPDRHGYGTNVMLSHPVSLARFAFGTDSYSKHQLKARESGAHIETYRGAGTALDIDTPDDLHYLEAEGLVKESTA